MLSLVVLLGAYLMDFPLILLSWVLTMLYDAMLIEAWIDRKTK